MHEDSQQFVASFFQSAGNFRRLLLLEKLARGEGKNTKVGI